MNARRINQHARPRSSLLRQCARVTTLIVALCFPLLSTVSAAPGDITWQPKPITASVSNPSLDWTAVASSADGSHLAGAVAGGYIYISTDGGTNWAKQTGVGSRNWSSLALSADGQAIVAGVSGGYIYTSSDAGASWSERTGAGSRYWSSVASSPDGSHLAATVSGGYIYTSTNSGVSWTEQTGAGSQPWMSIISRNSGATLIAGSYSWNVYLSTDGGATWTSQSAMGSRHWRALAANSDGSRIISAIIWSSSGYLCMSVAFANSCSESANPSAGQRQWSNVTSSDDGVHLTALAADGTLSYSSDSGSSWQTSAQTFSSNSQALAASADGSKLIVGGANDHLYRSVDGGITWSQLTIGPTMQSASAEAFAASADGSHIVAIDTNFSPMLYASSNSGATWTGTTLPFGAISASSQPIALSNDGSHLAVIDASATIHLSSNFGQTWTNAPPVESGFTPLTITLSTDGNVVMMTGYAYDATDNTYHAYAYTAHPGDPWSVYQLEPPANYHLDSLPTLASSDNGATILVGVTYTTTDYSSMSTTLYLSTNAGASWRTIRTDTSEEASQTVAISGDGTTLAYADSYSSIATSNDLGQTWHSHTVSSSPIYPTSIVMSEHSETYALLDYNGNLSTSSDNGLTWQKETTKSLRSIQPLTGERQIIGLGTDNTIYQGSIGGPATSSLALSTLGSSLPPLLSNATLSATSSSCYTFMPNSVKLLGPTAAPAQKPSVTIFGGVSYSLDCTQDGGMAQIQLSLGDTVDSTRLRVYKTNSAHVLEDVTNSVNLQTKNGQTVLSFAVQDGGSGDEDGIVNGKISDPLYIGEVPPSSDTQNLADTGTALWMPLLAGAALAIGGSSIVLAYHRRDLP